jgi:hypothetical protein
MQLFLLEDLGDRHQSNFQIANMDSRCSVCWEQFLYRIWSHHSFCFRIPLVNWYWFSYGRHYSYMNLMEVFEFWSNCHLLYSIFIIIAQWIQNGYWCPTPFLWMSYRSGWQGSPIGYSWSWRRGCWGHFDGFGPFHQLIDQSLAFIMMILIFMHYYLCFISLDFLFCCPSKDLDGFQKLVDFNLHKVLYSESLVQLLLMYL